MADEKYISIEYGKWNSYYKPLEEKLEKALKELEIEKENKKYTIYLTCNSMYMKIPPREIVNIHFEHPLYPTTKLKDGTIDYAVNELVNYLNIDRHHPTGKVMGREEFQEWAKKIEAKTAEFIEMQAAFKNKVRGLSKFTKWIFKLNKFTKE